MESGECGEIGVWREWRVERDEGTREEDTGLSIRRGWFSKAADAGQGTTGEGTQARSKQGQEGGGGQASKKQATWYMNIRVHMSLVYECTCAYQVGT